MDPVSITSVITAAGSVIHLVIKSITRLSDFTAKYREAPIIIISLLGQLCTIRTALCQLRAWSKTHLKTEPRYTELAQQVGDALSCFTTLIMHLSSQLDMHDQEESAGITITRRVSFLWKERDLKAFFQMLDCQVNAMTLLLQAVQCNDLAEQRRLLSSTDSKVILRCAQECSSSVRACKDGRSSRTFQSLLDDIDARPISKVFEFDSTLLESKVYSVAYRSHLKQLMIHQNLDEKIRQSKHHSLNPSITAIFFNNSNNNDDLSLHLTLPRSSTTTAATDIVRARQASYYSIRNGNRLIKRDPKSPVHHSNQAASSTAAAEYPISYDGFLPPASRAAVIDPSARVYAADVRPEPWRDWFSSIVHNPSLPLKGCSFAVALGWVAEEFASYRSSKNNNKTSSSTPASKDITRYFPSTLTDGRPGYLHLDLVAPLAGAGTRGGAAEKSSVISLSIRLVDVTEYGDTPPTVSKTEGGDVAGRRRDNQFLLVRIPRVVIRWSPSQTVDCYDT